MTIHDLLDKKISKSNRPHKSDEPHKVLLRNFAQELLTTKSPPLKPGYGTSFLLDIGEIVNPPKIRYYIDIHANKIAKKHGIARVDVIKTEKEGDSIIIELEAIADNGYVLKGEVSVLWREKIFTTEAIVER